MKSLIRIFFNSIWFEYLIHGKNNFVKRFKIFTEYKSENNFVGTLKITSNISKNVDILAIGLSVLHDYFEKLFFWFLLS